MQRQSLIHEVVFELRLWESLKRHLIRIPEDPDEQLAFLLAAPSNGTTRKRLLVREAILASHDDFIRQSPGGLEPKPEFIISVLNRCTTEGWSLIEVHSHPFSSGPGTTFSGIDWGNDKQKFPAVTRLLRQASYHATMVVGQDSLDVHMYDRETHEILPIDTVTIIGFDAERKNSEYTHIRTTSASPRNNVENVLPTRYDRHTAIFGQIGQQRLRDAAIGVVGVGGIGAFVALELAHLGIGRLILIDPDRVEDTNLNRLIGAGESDIGKLKVEVITRLVQAVSPDIQVDTVSGGITDPEALDLVKDADIIAGCVDNHGARMILNQLSLRQLIPLIDAGTGIQPIGQDKPLVAGGQVQTVIPGSGCLECRGFIDMERATYDLAPPALQEEARAHGYGIEGSAPSVIFLNGVVASTQVAEIVYLLTGELMHNLPTSPMYIMYNALARSMRTAGLFSSVSCVSCGLDGVIGVGDLGPIKVATDRAISHIPTIIAKRDQATEDQGADEQIVSAPQVEMEQIHGAQATERHSKPPRIRRWVTRLAHSIRRSRRQPTKVQAEIAELSSDDLNRLDQGATADNDIVDPSHAIAESERSE